MLPFIPLAVGAVVAGAGFALGMRISDRYIIPTADKALDSAETGVKKATDTVKKTVKPSKDADAE
ncbi:hypothetical protein [Magnetospira sp. QH-2]|uniref:hypothetical protein n=1 Tax=Magnetospira sp. (strain QH-2) TaxID=1288970 RepID=UPI0005FA1C7C|nr:hypothetical protein [Magnetospira sp. QH-2]